MNKIKVVNKKIGKRTIYIGRGSPLGNPFAMKNSSDGERERVCELYEGYIRKQIAVRTPDIVHELNKLYKLAKNSDIELSCFCAPKRCHGDTIRTLLMEKLCKIR